MRDKTMKRIISRVVAVSALAAASLNAANAGSKMVYKAPPPPRPAPAATWTSCYIGGNAGYGRTDLSASDIGFVTGAPVTPPASFGSQYANSIIGGGQIGCDYQVDSQWVVGIKAQFDYGNFKGQNITPAFPAFALDSNSHYVGTATARVGYIVAPNWLLYAQGGGAWVHDTLAVDGIGPPPFVLESASSNRYGYAAGGGIEYMFAPNWSAFAEYNYLGFGTRNVPFTLAAGQPGTANVVTVKQDVQTAVVGLNYHFNMDALFAAR
jgi:outer membrane immunogenic protein